MISDGKRGKSLIEEQVYRHLEKNPDFLTQHPHLLELVQLKHGSGQATSLIEHQVAQLREKNSELGRQMQQLIQIAAENEKLMSRLHRLSLRLSALENLSEFFTTLEIALASDFDAEQLYVGLFCELQSDDPIPSVNQLNGDDPELKQFSAFLDGGETICGRLKQEKLTFLFADFADEVESTALVPLGKNSEYGFLAIGSGDPNRFYPGMGTLFLELLGDVVSHRLAKSKLEPRRRSA